MQSVGIRTKIIIITLIVLGGGFFVAPDILEQIAEIRYRSALEDGRERLVEELEQDYKNLNLRNSPRIGDYFVFIYDNQSGKLIREYSYFPPRLIVDGIERLFVVSYIIASLFVVLGILISLEIALRPVNKSIKKISQFEPLAKVERLDGVKSNDEIGKLISTFNSLLEKVHISSISQMQFISNASHELKTPLTSLKLQIEKLKKEGSVEKKNLAGIEEDIFEIQSILEALLTLETSSKGGGSYEEINLNNLIKTTVEGTDIDFKNNLQIKVIANQKILKLMLNNLIGNAEKFKSKKIIISTELIGESPSVIVEDDGVGINPENYDLIFTPFWQEDESRTRNSGGKGLGLSIVKNIVTKYGWSVSVDRSKLGGAKFIVSF